MDSVIAFPVATLFGSLTLSAFFLVVGALFPGRVARTRAIVDGSPGRAFGIGLVNLLFFSIVSCTFFVLADNMRLPLLALPGTNVLAFIVIGQTFGLAGLVQVIGERLAPTRSAAARTIWGALALCLGCATPIVGWFVLLPFALIMGMGAFVLSFLYTRPIVEAAEVMPELDS